MNASKGLILDRLVADPHLARQLPAGVARRYHAVPIAEQDGCITVAMADPDDATALHAVTSALDRPALPHGDPDHLFVVRGDEAAIDALVAEIWEDPAPHRPAVTVCQDPAHPDHDLKAYAEAIGQLLRSQPPQSIPSLDRLDDLAPSQGDRDLLVVVGAQHRSGVKRLLRRTPTSVLLVGRTCWPLTKLLLVIQGTPKDLAAVNWAVRLARPAAARAVVLAVVPPLPAMYAGLDRMAYDLPALVRSETVLGRSLRQAARWLVNWEVDGTLRLRQGVPAVEIAREVCDGSYDMVVAGSDAPPGLEQWLAGGLMDSLLGCIEQPLLLAQAIGLVGSGASPLPNGGTCL